MEKILFSSLFISLSLSFLSPLSIAEVKSLGHTESHCLPRNQVFLVFSFASVLRLPVLPRIDFEASPIKVHVVIEESSQQIMYCNLHVRKYLQTRNKPDNIYKKNNNIRVNHDNTLYRTCHNKKQNCTSNK